MGRSASRFHRDVSNFTAWSPSKIQTRAAIDIQHATEEVAELELEGDTASRNLLFISTKLFSS